MRIWTVILIIKSSIYRKNIFSRPLAQQSNFNDAINIEFTWNLVLGTTLIGFLLITLHILGRTTLVLKTHFQKEPLLVFKMIIFLQRILLISWFYESFHSEKFQLYHNENHFDIRLSVTEAHLKNGITYQLKNDSIYKLFYYLNFIYNNKRRRHSLPVNPWSKITKRQW